MGTQNTKSTITITESTNQSTASCFNFAEGGKKYSFYIQAGKVREGNGEYSAGKYYSMEDGYTTLRSLDKIIMEKVAASCNRVFCYGKDEAGKHRFFWAQPTDSFPHEPGGNLPGLFDGYCNDEEIKKELRNNFGNINKDTSNHPFWFLQRLTKNAARPVVVKAGKWYEINLPCPKKMSGSDKEEAPLKDSIKEVLDIGIADIERYESYNAVHGGEIQAWRYPHPVEKELFALGPLANVQDANGFNDGTCNLFILAELEEGYSILWCDEQAGPSQYWRRLTPKDSTYDEPIDLMQVHSLINIVNKSGQKKSLLSGTPFLNDWITENRKHGLLSTFNDDFENSMPYGEKKKATEKKNMDVYVNKLSRMAVSRYPILLTTKDKIYSISFMWGTTDFCWVTRSYPLNNNVFKAQKLEKITSPYTKTIEIRDDTTIYIFGSYDGIQGVFYQNYLPQHLLKDDFAAAHYSKSTFDHEWRFVLPEIFQAMDAYYNFGIYDAWPDPDTKNKWAFTLESKYGYKGIDPRTQFYIVQVTEGNKQALIELIGNNIVEWERIGGTPQNPIFSDYKKDGKLIPVPLNITLRWDAVDKTFVAVYSHPRNNDLKKNMSGKLNGEWKPKNNPEPGKLHHYKLQFLSPDTIEEKQNKIVNDGNIIIPTSEFENSDVGSDSRSMEKSKMKRFRFHPPAVKLATVKYDQVNKVVNVTVEPADSTIRFITVGAVVNGVARPITERKAITKIKTSYSDKDGLLINIKGDPSQYFKKDSHIQYGTSVWFEDIVGHKSTPEELKIEEG